MKTISVKIKSDQISKYGLRENAIVDFSELVDKITRDFALQALENAQSEAVSAGLSNLTAEEINAEVRSLRNENRP